jgi:hypothetical protein
MNDRLYFTQINKLKWYCLKSFELEEHKGNVDCKLFSCVQLEDGSVLVNAAIKVGDGSQTQQSFWFNNGRIEFKKEPSLGLIGLQMVSLNNSVYYINGQLCEKFNLESNIYEKLENLNYNHIKGGTCVYNQKILVISGINCREIESYGEERYWIRQQSLPVCLFDLTCIQIAPGEVLCINSQRTYRVSPETGECFATSSKRVNAEVKPIKKGGYVYCLNYKNQLLRYSLKDDKWSNLIRTRCCSVF